MSGIYFPLVNFSFLGSSCCPCFSSFVKARFTRAFIDLWKLISSFPSFVGDHVRAFLFMWKLILFEFSFFYENPCTSLSYSSKVPFSPVHSLLVWVHLLMYSSHCMHFSSGVVVHADLGFQYQYFCPVVIIGIQTVLCAHVFLGT